MFLKLTNMVCGFSYKVRHVQVQPEFSIFAVVPMSYAMRLEITKECTLGMVILGSYIYCVCVRCFGKVKRNGQWYRRTICSITFAESNI